MSRSYDMVYHPEQDRWIVTFDGEPYGMHCGENFEIIVGRQHLTCTLELGSQWYVITERVRFNLREQEKYHVIL